ncbi:MAG TPA: tetratricopeptide repeat protein [Williamwhitmania sp.]|nr:tetratricopeptide repeat protein [Williamwhitmania sp.]
MRSIRINLASVFTGLLSIVACSTSFGQDLQTAIGLTKSEQYEEAEKIFNQLVQKEPTNSNYYFYYGENILRGYFSDTISNSLKVSMGLAKDQFEKGIKADSLNPLNYIGLAKVAFYLDDDQTAANYRARAHKHLPPYKKVSKIADPKSYAFALAKLAESYIKNDAVDTTLALPLIREAKAIDPKDPDIFIIAGDIYIDAKDASTSIKNYNMANYLEPNSPTANMKIGTIYMKSRAFQAAIPYYEQAIAQDANYAPAYRELGELYSLAGMFDKSETYYKKYLEITNGNLPAKVSYVNSLYYAKKYDKVISNVEEIFKVDQSRTYLNRIAAYSCFDKTPQDLPLALKYMNTLFKEMPEERLIQKDYIYYAKILIAQNKNYPKLLQDSTQLSQSLAAVNAKYDAATGSSKDKVKPQIDTLTSKLSNVTSQLKTANDQLTKAFDSYNKALAFTPNNRGLEVEIAMANYNLGRYNQAAAGFEGMLNANASDASQYLQIGKLYYLGKNFIKAESVFNEVTTKFPDELSGYVWLANTCSSMDPDSKSGLALPKFQMVIEKGRVDSVKNAAEIFNAYRYMGYYYLLNKDYEKSKAYYTMMLNLAPNNKDYQVNGYNNLATLYYQQGNYDKALECCNSALSLDPSNENAKALIQAVKYAISRKQALNPNLLTGVVKSASGQPIPSASVRVKDTAAETLTGLKGEFSFEIPEGSTTLIVSAKGFTSKEVTITKARTYNITLQ